MKRLGRFGGVISTLVEAWGEVRVQKTRVVLSLIGVTCAVAAMSTVIALGELTTQSMREMADAGAGRQVTFTVDPGTTPENYVPPGMSGPEEQEPTPEETAATHAAERDADAQFVTSPTSQALVTLAKSMKIPYWSRNAIAAAALTEVKEAQQTGQFRGKASIPPPFDAGTQDGTVNITLVDPSYAIIYRLQPTQGRWLQSGDVNQRVLPVVVNEQLWRVLGRPNIADPIVLHESENEALSYKIVGVVPNRGAWDTFSMYVPYDGYLMMHPDQLQISTQLNVWVSPEQAKQARKQLPATLKAIMGKGAKPSVYGGQNSAQIEDSMVTARIVIMIVGGIVIALGALGLLNVAIVTVGQRIREIGIRRALGASAKRVFFAVFMESVVATLVAGVIGVIVAVIVVRLLPLQDLGISLQEQPAFPMSAAIAGVGISTLVGALCGIIPAVAAVRVKPIEAIRY